MINTPHVDRQAGATSVERHPEPKRIALCHEWLSGRSGSEKTFETMAQEFPGADLFSLTWNRSAHFDFGGRSVKTTALDRIAPLRGRTALQLPLMPLAWRYASRREYDLVVTSSHACSKGFYPGRRAIHLCYCYTPMRYLWLSDIDIRHRWGDRLTAPVSRALKSWDRKSVGWVDDFAGISHAVKDRIEDLYSRPARVIHPPVATNFYTPGEDAGREDFVLAVSRMVPYKRLDLAIRAARIAGIKLVIAGTGPQEQHLRQIAEGLQHPVEFVISPSDAALKELYRAARAVIFPPEEDFGIVPVEAQACGTPVVALGRGGALDTVVDGVTGFLAPEQSAECFADGLKKVLDGNLRTEDCVANAGRFSQSQFRNSFREWVLQAAEGKGS